ncbi:SurA N-terminal domain-containing protein [Massilia glaciei]|uniref:Periplasmic chaperone PpiD n=1 Tax=Massilia glaciei TaxID=1524097 RepID=A0A2U2HGC8_9BURK|nr:SurA N-terminal domain-containing protein [Massilia glaciei]PWF43975.1 peptidylprolyl isomerase [Massilia glaciei]
MLEFIRNQKRFVQFFLGLIILAFAVTGVGTQFAAGDADTVVKVGETKVTQSQWDEAQRQQLVRYRQMAGDQFDARMFETPEAKQRVLERLITEAAITNEMARNHMAAGDKAVQKYIASTGDFRKPDGSFDYEQYNAAILASGQSSAMYENSIRRELTQRQVSSALEASAIVPRTVSKRLSDLAEEEREVQEVLFPSAAFVAQVAVTPELIKSYYDKNTALFKLPEQAQIEYLVFNADSVANQVTASDAEVAAVYNDSANKARFVTPEQRKASHILINAPKSAPAADKAAAKAKAEALLAQVRAAPAEFAAVAKANSQDSASAELGGDLGVVTPESVDPVIAAAAAKLKQGEISGLVESDYGYHIVMLTSVTPQIVKPLDEAKADIVAELKKVKASKLYKELAEEFTDTLYQESTSLKPVADKLKLTIATADVTRTPSPAAGSATFNHPKFLEALFAADSLKKRHNTEPVEVAPATLVAGRIVKHKPASVRPLAEVEAVIRERVVAEQAAALARKAGQAKLAEAKASGDAAGFGAPQVVSRIKEPTIDPAAGLAVLKANVSKLPAYVGVDLPGKGYGVYRIGKVTQPATTDVARRSGEQEQIAAAQAQQELFAYLEAVKAKAGVKRLAAPAAAPAQ